MLPIKPLKKEKDYYCGPACLKMVFDYYGVIKTQKEWARLSGTTRDGV